MLKVFKVLFSYRKCCIDSLLGFGVLQVESMFREKHTFDIVPLGCSHRTRRTVYSL